MVNFGLPLAPGFLFDSGRVRVLDSRGAEIRAAVRPPEPWRVDGKEGSLRSVQIQFRADFRCQPEQLVTVIFGEPRTRSLETFVPVVDTLSNPIA